MGESRGCRRSGLFAMLAAGLCASACTDPALVEGQQEIAAELRALRMAMHQSQRTTPADTAPTMDRQTLVAALSPLREVLDGLAAQQRELETRQLALTQELQRWSQLLAQSVTGSNRAETEALTARLQQLEATIKQQDARHQEVEKLIGGALDRTADRLEDFLRRLDGTAPGNVPATPTPGSGGAPVTSPAAGSPGGEVADPPARRTGALDPGPGAVSPVRARRNVTMWWLGLRGTTGVAGVVFVWRWRRSSAARTALEHGGPAARGGHAPEGALDPGVQELWAAAAMLGEAVGKLKQSRDGASRADLDEGIQLDEVIVLDEERASRTPAVPAAEPIEARPERPPAHATPPTLRRHVPARNPGQAVPRLLLELADDPRVLRRPLPTATASAAGVDLTFAVLPGLSPGELSHLEQRLRDAV